MIVDWGRYSAIDLDHLTDRATGMFIILSSKFSSSLGYFGPCIKLNSKPERIFAEENKTWESALVAFFLLSKGSATF